MTRHKIATLPRAEEVEDDGFVTVSIAGLEAAAVAADGRNDAPAPQSRSERYLASLKAENDRDESRLAAIEAELIAVQEGHEVRQRQARAEYQDAVRLAKAALERAEARIHEDTQSALDSLTIEKGDLSNVVNARHAAIESIVKESAE